MAGSLTGPVTLTARTAVTADDWRAAIRAACAPLVELHAVEPRYADRCISIVEDQGPYIVVAPGIALAHARPEDGVRELCASAVTLARPVRFGHPVNDPVHLVIAFGSPDRSAHVGLLAALARQLAAGLADRLAAADSPEAATSVLKEVINDAS
jgi:PTS system ascorbate-specific IIA component